MRSENQSFQSDSGRKKQQTEQKKSDIGKVYDYSRSKPSEAPAKRPRSTASAKKEAIRQNAVRQNSSSEPKKRSASKNSQTNLKNNRRQTIKPQQKTNIPVTTRGPKMMPPKKRHRKNTLLIGVLLFILAAVILFIGFCFWQVKSNLNNDLKNNSIRKTYGISDEAAEIALDHRVINVLVFGLDGRDDEGVEGDRSDAMMLCSADLENGGIKITSLMRDTYTWIPEEDAYDKLNAAFFYGGAEGAIKAVNTNFDTAITDYLTINFESMVYMVDAVGGVEVTITDDEEAEWTDAYTADVAIKLDKDWNHVTEPGTYTFDGCQALGYCRVRYAGNGDYDRTQRQRNVLEQVIGKVLQLNPLEQYRLLMKVLPYVETSMSFNEIIKYGLNILMMEGKNIAQMRLPTDDYVGEGMMDDVSYVYPDTLVDNIKALYRFIYKIDYVPSETAQSISDEINFIWNGGY